MTNGKMYLVVRKHFIIGDYPEDNYDYGDTYVGVFKEKYLAANFIKALPSCGEEYTEEGDDPDKVRRFKVKDDCDDDEYIMYFVEEVIQY